MSDDKENIISKIKKLLNLAEGVNNSQAEKDLALNRAKEMMAQHSIADHDIKDAKITDLIIEQEYIPQLNNPLPSYFFDPALMLMILNPIVNNFGCYVVFYPPPRLKVCLVGFKTNIEIASYACDVLLKQGLTDFREGYKKVRSIGYAVTFWNGFAEGLQRRFTKLSNETAIVLYDKVKEKIHKECRIVEYDIPYSNEVIGHSEGFKSAIDAQLNRAVSKNEGNLLK